MTDPLQKLFGTPARVKLLRLFLFNPGKMFSIAEAASRARVTAGAARREVAIFTGVRLIARAGRAHHKQYTLREDFSHLASLQQLLLNAPARGEDILERIGKVGAIKLLVVSGIFFGQWEGSLDILIVGDRLNERRLRQRIRSLESELGKELRYAVLTTQDLHYRLNMNDKLVRDMFDFPHRILLDKLQIGLK